MGTLVLQAHDQLSLDQKMGTLLLPGAPTNPTKQPYNKLSASTVCMPKPLACIERALLEMRELPATAGHSFSSNPPAFSSILRSASASPQTFRPSAGSLAEKSYFQPNSDFIRDCGPPQRPASASGRGLCYPLDQSKWSAERIVSAKAMAVGNSHYYRSTHARALPRSFPELKKQAQFFKAPAKALGHANHNSIRAISRSANSNPLLLRTVKQEPRDEKVSKTPMKVTILQRPKTKEDALCDFSKHTGVPLTELHANNGLGLPFPVDDSATAVADEVLGLGKFSGLVVGSQKASCENERQDEILIESTDSSQKSTDPSEELTPPFSMVEEQESLGVEELRSNLFSKTQISCFLDPIDCNTLSERFAFFDPDLLAEKWAGPCFAISPPPSSLPLPKFATSTLPRTVNPEMQSVHELKGVCYSPSASASAPAPASPVGGELSHMPKIKCQKNIIDTAVATKDLKRMLHLDFS